MNRWNQLKSGKYCATGVLFSRFLTSFRLFFYLFVECDSCGPVYQNVQTLKSEIDRLNEICKSAKKESNQIQKNQLLHHQQILESALADLELSSKPSYPDINGNQYYSNVPQNNFSTIVTPSHQYEPEASQLYANIVSCFLQKRIRPSKTFGDIVPLFSSNSPTVYVSLFQ